MHHRVRATFLAALTLAACAKTNTATVDSSGMAAGGQGGAAARNASADPAAARHAIDSTNAAFSQALDRGDVKGLMAAYASDAIADFPGAPVTAGADAISKLFEQDFAGATLTDATLHTDDVLAGGDLVVENGTFSWTLTPKPSGKSQKQTGHYLVAWQRQPDGAWKIVRDFATADPAKE